MRHMSTESHTCAENNKTKKIQIQPTAKKLFTNVFHLFASIIMASAKMQTTNHKILV